MTPDEAEALIERTEERLMRHAHAPRPDSVLIPPNDLRRILVLARRSASVERLREALEIIKDEVDNAASPGSTLRVTRIRLDGISDMVTALLTRLKDSDHGA